MYIVSQWFLVLVYYVYINLIKVKNYRFWFIILIIINKQFYRVNILLQKNEIVKNDNENELISLSAQKVINVVMHVYILLEVKLFMLFLNCL